MASRVLIVGGVRAGKSTTAASLLDGCEHVLYVATGTASDAEMSERIAGHQADRPAAWTTVETADIHGALQAAPSGAGVIIDALAGWLADRMSAHGLWVDADERVAPLGAEGRARFEAVVSEAEQFWELAAAHDGAPVVLVADESGLGVTPTDPSSRRWLDLAAAVTRRLAVNADRALFCVAGRVLELPSPAPGPPVDPAADTGPAGLSRVHGDTMVPEGALDFAVNVHAPPPPHVRRAIETADTVAYPDEAPARAAAAARHGRPTAETLVTAGAAEAFWLLPRVVSARHACVVHPAFTEPEAALRAAGIPVTRAYRRAEDGWRLDPAAVPDDADVVVLGNPNNPTGALDDPETVAALARPGRLTVVDEAFMDFRPDERDSLATRSALPGLVVVRSVTKLWGLAGLRVGYLLGPAGLVARCEAARQPWPVAAPALEALVACLADEDYRRAVAARVTADRDRLAADLEALPGVTVAEGAANFLLVRLPATTVRAALAERGMAVRPATFPGLDDEHVRVTVRDGQRNRLLAEALADVLGEAA